MYIYIVYMNYLLYIDTSIKNDIHLHGLLAYSFCFCFFPGCQQIKCLIFNVAHILVCPPKLGLSTTRILDLEPRKRRQQNGQWRPQELHNPRQQPETRVPSIPTNHPLTLRMLCGPQLKHAFCHESSLETASPFRWPHIGEVTWAFSFCWTSSWTTAGLGWIMFFWHFFHNDLKPAMFCGHAIYNIHIYGFKKIQKNYNFQYLSRLERRFYFKFSSLQYLAVAELDPEDGILW